jgi:hypothetical protein
MQFKISQYEVKRKDSDHWQHITELAVLRVLQKRFGRVTPVLVEMLQGKEIATPCGVFRIQKINTMNLHKTKLPE